MSGYYEGFFRERILILFFFFKMSLHDFIFGMFDIVKHRIFRQDLNGFKYFFEIEKVYMSSNIKVD